MPDLLERLGAALADRYAVREEVGRGGMAIVFRAEDLRHHRQVAIKVLHPELSAALGADRFLKEIEIVAGLTHPHILPLFDSGEADGLLYYIMPYLEGESLRERLHCDEQLAVEEAIRITKEVASALDHAHRRGFVHRDIKPGNILLSDQHAFVTDFGIARALDAAGGEGLTRTGIVVGTPAYMSPEQAGGESEVGSRSDQYALACVLHEMLVGTVPFSGTTPQAVLARHMIEDPRPIRQVRHEVSPSVERALARALAKEPGARFESCEQFAHSLAPASGWLKRAGSVLRRLRYAGRSRLQGRPALASAVGAVGLAAVVIVAWLAFGLGRPGGMNPTLTAGTDSSRGVTRVAVLYFEDLSEDGSLAPYAAGFTKGLIRRLNAVSGLAAPSYTAVRKFQGTNVGPDSLGAALGVNFLAEGAVLPTADGLQIEVDLVDAESGLQVGFVQQRAMLAQLTELLESVADSLALAIRPELGQQVRLRELRGETSSDRALDLLWRAEELSSESDRLMELEMPDRDGAEALLVRADSLLSEAQVLDPMWTEPPVQRGWVAHRRARVFTEVAQEYGLGRLEVAREGLQHASRALELDPQSPEALELRGTIRYGLARREVSEADRNSLLAAAESDLRASVAADAQRATAWRVLGDLLNGYRADFEGAREAFRRALQADRFLADAQNLTANLIGLSTDLEDYEEAWHWVFEGRRRWPEDVTFPYAALLIMASRSALGDVERAWAYWDTIQQTWPGDRKDAYLPIVYADVAAVLGLAGLGDSARAVLERGINASPNSAFPAYNVSHAYLVLGDTAASLQWLEVDLAADPGKEARRAVEPWFEPLHGNPQFEALVAVAEESLEQ